jgi:biotin carboxylase
MKTGAKRVMVVGAGWDQVPIIRTARQQGHFVIALDGNAHAYGLQEADKALVISTRDIEAVLQAAITEHIDAITYMITESPLPAIRRVVEELGLPGPSAESVEATVSKARMREIFSAAGIPNPRFGRAATLAEALQIARDIGAPLVMKPTDVGGQLGLSFITDLAAVPAAFERAQGQGVSGEVMFEEWLDGNEVNVVAIVVNGRVRVMTVSDRMKHPVGGFGVVQRHLFPAACSEATLSQIADLSQQVVTAMHVHTGIVFPQMILTSAGPRIVEIGERIPGGVMKELFELATGYDLVRFQLDVALGQVLDLDIYCSLPKYPAVTVRFLTAEPGTLRPGHVARVLGREAALALPGVVDVNFYNDPTQPQEIRPLGCGRDRFYTIIAVGDSCAEAVARGDAAAARLDFLDAAGNSLVIR